VSLKGTAMSFSTAPWVTIAATASLLCLSNLTYAQSESPQTQVQTVDIKSCWRPEMARNIGIAEPSCDAPIARLGPAVTPNNKNDRNGKDDGNGTSPQQPTTKPGV
jgi:hypothetical protein